MSFSISVKSYLKKYSNYHNSSNNENLFLFTMPRSGSTWLMELLSNQPGIKYCNEPLYLTNPLVKKYSGLKDWKDLHNSDKLYLMEDYFKKFIDGKLGFLNPTPLGDYYKPLTNRIVFKIIHGGEDRINWFRDRFNGKIIYLIRHPLAVALSHTKMVRLYTLLDSEYKNNFSEKQIKFSKEVISNGTMIEKVVLSWCLQNFVPLKYKTEDWAFVTYEQLVKEPEIVVKYLKKKLGLKNTQKILKNINKPSLVKNLSNDETINILKNKEENSNLLLSKWRKKISLEEELKLFEIINEFELDIYSPNSFLPNSKYLISN